MHQTENCTIMS